MSGNGREGGEITRGKGQEGRKCGRRKRRRRRRRTRRTRTRTRRRRRRRRRKKRLHGGGRECKRDKKVIGEKRGAGSVLPEFR